MDIEHCVIAGPWNLRDSYTPQINAVTTSYLYVLSPTLTLAGFGVFDAAKLQLFPDMERKKNPASQKTSRNKDEEIVILFLLTNL